MTWAQVAALLNADGIKAADGSDLTPDETKALYHAERYARPGTRRKRRPVQPKAPQGVPPSPAWPEVPDPPPVTPMRPEVVPPSPPSAAVPYPANPWAEVDRQKAEAQRRRDERAAGKEWNPYATKEKTDE